MEVAEDFVCDHGMPKPWVTCIDCMELPFDEQPKLRARLMHTIADTYFTLNRRSEAQLLVARVLALRREHLEPFHRDTLKAMHLEALLMAGTALLQSRA